MADEIQGNEIELCSELYSFQSRDVTRLMACLGYVLSVLPVNEIMEYLDVLLAPHIEQLQQIGTMEVGTNNTRLTSLSNYWLVKLTTLVQYVFLGDPC